MYVTDLHIKKYLDNSLVLIHEYDKICELCRYRLGTDMEFIS